MPIASPSASLGFRAIPTRAPASSQRLRLWSCSGLGLPVAVFSSSANMVPRCAPMMSGCPALYPEPCVFTARVWGCALSSSSARCVMSRSCMGRVYPFGSDVSGGLVWVAVCRLVVGDRLVLRVTFVTRVWIHPLRAHICVCIYTYKVYIYIFYVTSLHIYIRGCVFRGCMRVYGCYVFVTFCVTFLFCYVFCYDVWLRTYVTLNDTKIVAVFRVW